MELNRRDFLKGAGALGALGAMGTLASCAPASPKTAADGASEGSTADGALTAQSATQKWNFEIPPEPIAARRVEPGHRHEVPKGDGHRLHAERRARAREDRAIGGFLQHGQDEVVAMASVQRRVHGLDDRQDDRQGPQSEPRASLHRSRRHAGRAGLGPQLLERREPARRVPRRALVRPGVRRHAHAGPMPSTRPPKPWCWPRATSPRTRT